jgi:hypothetical protein
MKTKIKIKIKIKTKTKIKIKIKIKNFIWKKFSKKFNHFDLMHKEIYFSCNLQQIKNFEI